MTESNLSEFGDREEIEIRYAVIESSSYSNLLPGLNSQRKQVEMPSNFLHCEFKGRFTSILLFDEHHPGLLPEISISHCQKTAISPTAGSNRLKATDTERLAHFISTQPDEILLSKCKNKYLLWEWIKNRNDNILIAVCFLAASSDNPQNPLQELLKAELIDKWEYKYIWTGGLLLANLWQVISLNYHLLETNFKRNWDYPFESCRELACEIIGKDLNDQLKKKLALSSNQKYYEYKPSQIKEISNLRRTTNKRCLSSEKNEKYWKLIDRNMFEPNIWSEHLADICNELIKMDSKRLFAVAPTLENLWRKRCDYISQLATLMYSRQCSNKATPHERWINNRKMLRKLYK